MVSVVYDRLCALILFVSLIVCLPVSFFRLHLPEFCILRSISDLPLHLILVLGGKEFVFYNVVKRNIHCISNLYARILQETAWHKSTAHKIAKKSNTSNLFRMCYLRGTVLHRRVWIINKFIILFYESSGLFLKQTFRTYNTNDTMSKETMTPITNIRKVIPAMPMLVEDWRSSGALSNLFVDDDISSGGRKSSCLKHTQRKWWIYHHWLS